MKNRNWLSHQKLGFLLFIALVFISCFSSAYGEELLVGTVSFVGNERTSPRALKNAIILRENTDFKEKDLEDSIQDLKNTNLFRNVEVKTSLDPHDPKRINIAFYLDEKWTLIPYAIAGSGGGSSYYGFGLLDSNFLGTMDFALLQFSMNSGKPQFATRYISSNTFHLTLTTGFSSNLSNKTFTFYSDNLQTGYLSYRSISINPYIIWKFNQFFSLGTGFLFRKFDNINKSLTIEQILLNEKNHIEQPSAFSESAAQLIVQLGKIDYGHLTRTGVLFRTIVNSTLGLKKNENNTDNTSTLVAFYPLLKSSYIAFRFGFLSTTSDNPVHQFFLGGLDKIRGFHDNQFFGKVAGYGNIEYRYGIWENNTIASQLVPFFDFASTSKNFHELLKNRIAASAGVGIRLSFLKINGLDFRLDYAQTLTPFQMKGFSFGVNQFF